MQRWLVWISLGVSVFAAFVLTGCRTAPIYSVNDTAISSGKPMTLEQVEAAIVRAGQQLGWTVRPVKPGELQATLILRTHTAIVSIPYSQTKFSIIYKSSVNLQHDGNQIHNNYNGWVRNLENRINQELSS